MLLSLQPPRRLSAPPLRLRGVWREREAVRIRVADVQGCTGLGEALPLPGFSPDDADAAHAALCAVAARGLAWPGADDTPGIGRIEATLAPWAGLLQAAPSARFALECALLDWAARRAGQSAAAWLAEGRALQPVPVSVLLPDDDDQALAAAHEAARLGHRVLKLKIARTDRIAAQEHALLAALREAVDAVAPGVRLRLDANGAMPAEGLPARVAELARHGIELIEEPLAGTALLAMPALPLPWAADESLAGAGLADALLALPAARRPAALVLKPALQGLARCLALARQAQALGVGVIVTHCLDGDIGLAAAGALAAALPAPPWPCGLAPHAGLAHAAPSTPWLAEPRAPGLTAGEGDGIEPATDGQGAGR